MDKNVEQFQADLLQSLREMKAGRAARVTRVPVFSVTAVRNAAGLTQAQFAAVLGVSRRTLQGLGQGRRQPPGAPSTLLRVTERHPELLRHLGRKATRLIGSGP